MYSCSRNSYILAAVAVLVCSAVLIYSKSGKHLQITVSLNTNHSVVGYTTLVNTKPKTLLEDGHANINSSSTYRQNDTYKDTFTKKNTNK